MHANCKLQHTRLEPGTVFFEFLKFQRPHGYRPKEVLCVFIWIKFVCATLQRIVARFANFGWSKTRLLIQTNFLFDLFFSGYIFRFNFSWLGSEFEVNFGFDLFGGPTSGLHSELEFQAACRIAPADSSHAKPSDKIIWQAGSAKISEEPVWRLSDSGIRPICAVRTGSERALSRRLACRKQIDTRSTLRAKCH